MLLGAGCSPAPGDESSGQQPGSTRSEHSVAVGPNHADAITVSSFVGDEPNFVMLVRWEEFGSAQIRGEMRLTEAVGCGSTDSGSPQLDTHHSRFKGTRDGSTVFLDLSPRNPGAPNGAWVGELVEAPEDGNASERLALRLRDPDGNQITLSEGKDQDYADAAARLAEDCDGETLGQS
jgi:hypothetical protein